MSHDEFMRRALAEARRAGEAGEVPVGAIVVSAGKVIGTGFNQPIRTVDPSAHAEIVALRAAAQAQGNYRLSGASLYVTLEPCLMCLGALVHARIGAVIYGVPDPKGGAIRSILDASTLAFNHTFEVEEGVLANECRDLLQTFFRQKRASTTH